MTIGDRIRQRRKELGLTQEELANKMGYSSRTAISNVEKGGEDLTSTRIEKYAKALECSPSYLMGWEDKTTSVFIATADVDGKNIVASTVTIPKPDDYDFKKRVAAYISYLSKNEYARNLIQEASKSSDEDIQLATEFLMRLNKKER